MPTKYNFIQYNHFLAKVSVFYQKFHYMRREVLVYGLENLSYQLQQAVASIFKWTNFFCFILRPLFVSPYFPSLVGKVYMESCWDS